MLRFLGRQLTYSRARSAVLGSAILVTALSFVLLTSAAETSEVRVQGSVESAFRPAYDILVRPRNSLAQLERTSGLVRDNYLSGLFGGISLEQYEKIKRIPRVEVAAPIANLGYVLPFGDIRLPLDDLLSKDPVQLYRLRMSYVAHGGLSRYPDDDYYVYYTRRNPFECCGQGIVEVVPSGAALPVCDGLRSSKPYVNGPFAKAFPIACFSEVSPGEGHDAVDPQRFPTGKVGAVWTIYFPILVAAIDPVQEARLLNLDEAVVSGRYLRAGETVRAVRGRVGHRGVPVIASMRTELDESLAVDVERLRIPPDAGLSTVLASEHAYRFLTNLRGRVVDRRLFPAQRAYEQLFRQWGHAIISRNYWVPRDVRYRGSPSDRLKPAPVSNSEGIWRSEWFAADGGFHPAPPSNADVQFRRLEVYTGSNLVVGNLLQIPRLRVVGRYDPAKLPGFNPLSRVPLETYYPPLLEPGDGASRRTLGGKDLRPTQNLGDYVQQPPLMLTTLEGLEPFLQPEAFKGPIDRRKALISAIRIRVSDVKGPDELSMARIRAVALAVRERTNLDVDITAGSSPRKLVVDLPPGEFGRPRLLLTEGWVKKGVSVAFLQALDKKTLALAGLVLLACGFFIGNGAFAVTRARQREIGTLLCLGWSQWTIFRAVLAELALVGCLAGFVGTVIAVALTTTFALELSVLQALTALPVAVAVALLTGLLPAWIACRSVPLDAVLPLRAETVHERRVSSLASMAIVNLTRMRGRTLIGIAGLLVGVAALTLLVGINEAFAGSLVGTLLGDAILVQVRGIDFASAALVIILASLALADVLYVNLRERAAEILTLRAVGWADADLRKEVALEALGLAVLGALGGAMLGFVVGILVFEVPLLPLARSALVAASGGILVALLASLAPMSQITRLATPTVLADE